jgi:hypothetical protein
MISTEVPLDVRSIGRRDGGILGCVVLLRGEQEELELIDMKKWKVDLAAVVAA